MELKNSIQRGSIMRDLNEFVLKILENKKKCEDYCKNIEDGSSFLMTNYEGKIREATLIQLVEKSKSELCYQCFLSDLAICLKEEDVTPKVFDKLISFRGKYRKSILIGLAHCDLSIYQLNELTKLKVDIESLLNLIRRVLKSDSFSSYDLEVLLKKYSNYFVDFSTSLSWMVEHYCDKNDISQEKILVLHNFFVET